jgi:hypothetical protein
MAPSRVFARLRVLIFLEDTDDDADLAWRRSAELCHLNVFAVVD